jgi:AbrB family looped-hinge helix DNA binding protein
MQTRISSTGQIVLPIAIRRQLGLRPGDSLDASVKSGEIVLAPRHRKRPKAAIVRDPVTGLPVLSVGTGVPQLTSKQVQDILSSRP